MPATLSIFVHHSAICESQDIGERTRLWAFSHVMDGAHIGRDCNICDHVYVEGGARIGDGVTVKNRVLIWDGVTIEDCAFIGPGVIFTNDRYPRSRGLIEVTNRYKDCENWLTPTTVRRGASIGAGAIILPGLTIGRFACVGAGAVVTRDVEDHRVVAGNPARGTCWACVCGVPLSDQFCCPQCERRYLLRNNTLVVAK